MRTSFALLTLPLVLAACDPGRPRAPTDARVGSVDAWFPRLDTNADAVGGGGGGGGGTDCAAGARWIYLVDSSRQLLRYEPDSDRLVPIGRIDCTASATPFSMAVDRNANAFVLHTDHRIYQVNTTTAACSPTSFAPDQMGFELFGMGFVSDEPGGTAETLFIGGGPEEGIGSGASTLGRIAPGLGAVSRVGTLAGSPELTGNGRAELWGYFPDSRPPSVREIHRTTGGTVRSFDVSGIGGGAPRAWAFAHWAAAYYIFIQTEGDASTNIFRVQEATGNLETVRRDIGYRIVGAGVSTCAPSMPL